MIRSIRRALPRPWGSVAALLLLASLHAACAAPAARGVGAADLDADHEAVLTAHTRMIAAYEAGDVQGVLAEMESSKELLIFHPFTEDRFDGVEEVRAGLTRMFRVLGETTWIEAHTSVVLSGDMAWLTTHFVLEASGAQREVEGRSTEVWRRTGRRWRMVHGHWSQNPEKARLAWDIPSHE